MSQALLISAAISIAAALTTFAPSGAAAAGLGQLCGGYVSIVCDNGLYCEFPVGMCRALDLSGKCARPPSICTEKYDPVCGCDSKTYGNDCKLRAAKVAKNYNGECRP